MQLRDRVAFILSLLLLAWTLFTKSLWVLGDKSSSLQASLYANPILGPFDIVIAPIAGIIIGIYGIHRISKVREQLIEDAGRQVVTLWMISGVSNIVLGLMGVSLIYMMICCMY